MAPTIRWGILGTNLLILAHQVVLTGCSHWRHCPNLHSRPPRRSQDSRCGRCRPCCHSCCQLQQQRSCRRVPKSSGSTQRCQSLRLVQRAGRRSKYRYHLRLHATLPALPEHYALLASREECPLREGFHCQCCSGQKACPDGQAEEPVPHGGCLDALLPTLDLRPRSHHLGQARPRVQGIRRQQYQQRLRLKPPDDQP